MCCRLPSGRRADVSFAPCVSPIDISLPNTTQIRLPKPPKPYGRNFCIEGSDGLDLSRMVLDFAHQGP